jgi:uncharacterized small protein (DUF1192 family)
MTVHHIDEQPYPGKCMNPSCASTGPGLDFGTIREVDGGVGPDGRPVPASWVPDVLCANCELVVLVANEVVSKAEHSGTTLQLKLANDELVRLRQRNVTGELAAKQRELDTVSAEANEYRVWHQQLEERNAALQAEIHALKADPVVIEKQRFLEQIRQAGAPQVEVEEPEEPPAVSKPRARRKAVKS